MVQGQIKSADWPQTCWCALGIKGSSKRKCRKQQLHRVLRGRTHRTSRVSRCCLGQTTHWNKKQKMTTPDSCELLPKPTGWTMINARERHLNWGEEKSTSKSENAQKDQQNSISVGNHQQGPLCGSSDHRIPSLKKTRLPPTCCEFLPDPEFRNSASIQIDVERVPSNESIRNERRGMQKGSEDRNMQDILSAHWMSPPVTVETSRQSRH